MVLLGVLLSLAEKERKNREKDGEFPWMPPPHPPSPLMGYDVRWVMSISQL